MRQRILTQIAVFVCVANGLFAARISGAVNLEWRPDIQNVLPDDIVTIGLYAVSDSTNHQSIGAISVILDWDPVRLELLGNLDDGPYDWEMSFFPNDSGLDGLNNPFTGSDPFVPANDGLALYHSFSQLQGPVATAGPDGLLVTTFRFRAHGVGITQLRMLATFGSYTTTRVLHGQFPGIVITGTLSAPSVVIVGQPSVLYVDGDASGNGDGTSWEDAMIDLHSALTSASAGGITEIWVAASEHPYTPAGPNGNRTASFELMNGLGVYGGFAGDESTRNQRNPRDNRTILSGDLNQNDAEMPATLNENSYHVARAEGTDATAILDGFMITAGRANGSSSTQQHGAGLYVSGGNPTIVNCVFHRNRATLGGGAYVLAGDPMFINTMFVGNMAVSGGGGAHNDVASDPTYTNCLFSGNLANMGGGAQNTFGSHPVFTNCTFGSNRATTSGGGIFNTNSSGAVVVNSIFWGNSDVGGFDESAQIHLADGSVIVTYSDVQGGWTGDGGTGNLSSDPLFIDADGADAMLGTMDDNLRLAADSPCLDAGNNDALPNDVTDVDDDGNVDELLPLDLDGRPRRNDDVNSKDVGGGTLPIVDLGAYELAADCNTNGVPDDLETGDGTAPDCNGNHVPDSCDIADGMATDCDANSTLDACDIEDGTSTDCNLDGVPDGCLIGVNGLDCNSNGMMDVCEVAGGDVPDCNHNQVPDACDIATGGSADCNSNGIPDSCDGGCGSPPGGGGGGGGPPPIEEEPPCSELDADDDGVNDCDDLCPDTGNGHVVSSLGCACAQRDTDADMVDDCDDECPSTPRGGTVNSAGCSCGQRDPDDDGVADCSDNCKALANSDQSDADEDGMGDLCDNCPNQANPNQADGNADGVGDACEEPVAPEVVRSCVGVRLARSDDATGSVSGGDTIDFLAEAQMRNVLRDDDEINESITETAQWSNSCGGIIERGQFVAPEVNVDTECTITALFMSTDGGQCQGSGTVLVEAVRQPSRSTGGCGAFGNCAPTGPSMILTFMSLVCLRLARRSG